MARKRKTTVRQVKHEREVSPDKINWNLFRFTFFGAGFKHAMEFPGATLHEAYNACKQFVLESGWNNVGDVNFEQVA